MKQKTTVWVATVLSLVLIFGNIGPIATAASSTVQQFPDVSSDHWAKDAIDFLTNRGVINGRSDGSFGVNDPVTRAEAVTMIMRSFGWGDYSGQENPGYTDVPENHWAFDSIAAVYHMDIFKPEGQFEPNKKVTRAEMADMIVEAFDIYNIRGAHFTDLTRDHWAYNSILVLAGSRITSGYADGTFRPEADVTRAEFAMFVSRALDERFRLKEAPHAEYLGAIYDLEIGAQNYQLSNPLLLTRDNVWYAPAELFEKMGFLVQSHATGQLTLTSTEGIDIQLYIGQKEIWVGETSVQTDNPLMMIDEQFYIAAHGILRALERPLVFYPDDFLIRLESPRYTVADLNRQAPDAVVAAVHDDMPYWHWTKRDRDHLELIHRSGANDKREQLQQEMRELTEAYLQAEHDKITINGIIYFSDHRTGKLDALSRGLEARYSLLFEEQYSGYPDVGKSGALGVFSRSSDQFHYIVDDHWLDHYDENKQVIIDQLHHNEELSLQYFDGLIIHGAPFAIRTDLGNGYLEPVAGKASGSRHMIVANSNLTTFIHEFGHNWDAQFGDHEQYLKLRGKQNYVPASNDWANRVQENFAEDFTAVFLPDMPAVGHKAVFGMPDDAMKEKLRQWFTQREQEVTPYAPEKLAINGMTLIPHVLSIADGQLHVEGSSGHHVFGTMKNVITGEETTIDFTRTSSTFDEVVQLPVRGAYDISIGSKQFYVVY